MPDNSTTDDNGTVIEHFQRATALFRQGRMAEALEAYKVVLTLRPNHIQAQFATAWLYRRSGDPGSAAAAYRRILELEPNNAEALNDLGALYHEYGGIQEAVTCYREAIRLKPDFIDAYNNLGGALQRLYLTDEAARSHQKALELKPDHPVSWELRIASLCPPVASSNEAADRFRAQLMETLARFSGNGFSASPEELVQTGAYPSYSLMYHGRDDRPVREAYARLFAPCFPHPPVMRRATGHRKVGLLVTRGHEDIFVRSMAGVLRHMDPARFDLTVICTTGRENHIAEQLDAPHVRLLPIPEQITDIVGVLTDARFDILYYWEIATDPLNYFLPFYRIAPIQCTSWGIQVTSGIPTVDYYLSSKLAEPQDADSHYTEKLICSDTLLTYQYRSRLPETVKRREDFGFRRDQHLYLFPQQMGKFHPDFDAVAGELLRRDPQGMLVILQGLWPYTARQLHQRLSRKIADVIDRVVFLPRLDRSDLLCLIADCEVLLDPPHYGGVNSSYDGFSMNTPVLTCESAFHIGRYTAACYRKMGLSDLVAPDLDAYVDMAVDLGTHPHRRNAFSKRVADASPALFEDMSAVHEHERIFDNLIKTLESPRS